MGPWLRGALALAAVLSPSNGQILQCATVADGCDGGAAHEASVRTAMERFQLTSFYGGRPITFSSFVGQDGALASISYTCLDGSTPPPLSGATARDLLGRVLGCPNRCGSVSISNRSNCGFGVLVANNAASTSCFSKAVNVVPESGRPVEVATAGGFTSIGCRTDPDVNNRVLKGGTAQASDMTVQRCAELARGFRYFGVQYSVECFWGNELGSASRPSTACDMPCGGDATQLCGGGLLMNGYEDPSWTAPPTTNPVPSPVPSVDVFQNYGCGVDSVNSRVLRAASTVDASSRGMTVEKCVKFGRDQGWRYAGVEYGSECFVGNTLRGYASASQSDCNMVCAGNPGQFCGAGNRIQVYEDKTWTDPTAADLARLLGVYYNALEQAQSAISTYRGHMEEIRDIRAGGQLRKRQPGSRTETIVLQEIVRQDLPAIQAAGSAINDAAYVGSIFFRRAGYLDIDTTNSPLLSQTQFGQIQEALASVESIVTEVTEAVQDDSASIVASEAGSTAPLLNVPRALDATGRASSLFGLWQPLGPKVFVAGGLFLVLGSIWAFFAGVTAGGGGGGDPGDGGDPVSTAQPTSTSTASCTPTMEPTPVVVLMNLNSNKGQFDEILSGLEEDKKTITERIEYDSVNFRAFVADLDDCDVNDLIEKEIVASVSKNIKGEIDASPAGAGSRVRRDIIIPPTGQQPRDVAEDFVADANITTGQNTKRATVPANFQNLWSSGALWDDENSATPKEVSASPVHLAWLTAPWAFKGFTGQTFYDFQDYLYDPGQGPKTDSQVLVYVLDTGVMKTHEDIRNNILESLDATSAIPGAEGNDNNGHGTCMISCVAGRLAGVHKSATVVSIKVSDDGQTLDLAHAVRAVGMVLLHKQQHPTYSYGVVSMSFGFAIDKIIVLPGQQVNKADPFISLLDSLHDTNLVAVASAGNAAESDERVDLKTPRRNGGRNAPLIVVGAAGIDSTRTFFSNFLDPQDTGIVSVYGPGDDVIAAVPGTGSGTTYEVDFGTSQATACVAGLLAMALGRGHTNHDDAKGWLIGEAKRLKGDNWPSDNPTVNPAPGAPRVGIDRLIGCTPANGAPVTIASQAKRETMDPWEPKEASWVKNVAIISNDVPQPACVQLPA